MAVDVQDEFDGHLLLDLLDLVGNAEDFRFVLAVT